MIPMTLEALQLSYAMLYVDDGLSRSFLTIFPPPKSSEGNIDVKKKIRSGVSLKEEDLAGITGWGVGVFEVFHIEKSCWPMSAF